MDDQFGKCYIFKRISYGTLFLSLKYFLGEVLWILSGFEIATQQSSKQIYLGIFIFESNYYVQ